MRRNMIALIILLTLTIGAGGAFAGASRPEEPSGRPVGEGVIAPDFTLKNMQGEEVALSDYRGKVVLLNFWATWCPPCKAEMPSMEQLYRTFSGRDFVMLAVNVEEDGKEVVTDFLKRHPHSFPILLDDAAQVQDLYGVYRFPESFILNKKGVVTDKIVGAIDWASADTVKYIDSLVRGAN